MSKQPTNSQSYRQLLRKHSRQILSETSDPSLSKETILNMNSFLESRKFEINELLKSQLSTKLASSSRVFQRLPRKLRRRTASHNVKRIPKRLRTRALKEMSKTENSFKITKKRLSSRQVYRLKTIRSLLKLSSRTNLIKLNSNESLLKLNKFNIRQRINKINKLLKNETIHRKLNNSVGSQDVSSINSLSKSPIGKLKYLKRQREFVWLSTHVWHAKRAHMIKRWGFQIPFKPTQKCFRLAHRNFNLSGGMCWDKSYINTLVLQTDKKHDEDLKKLIKLIVKNDKLGLKFFGNGCINNSIIYQKDQVLGKFNILSFVNDDNFKILIRLHPSIYQDFFNYLLDIKTENIQLIDNRFSIGSIDITGPIALQSLATILKPIDFKSKESQIFNKLACESSSIPDKTMFSLIIKDPRLSNRNKPRPIKDVNINNVLIDMKINKDNLNSSIINDLLTSEGRTKSYENQLSLKEVETLKKNSSKELIDQNGFPVIIYKNDNIYTVLLPWYWTLPVWYQLNHIAHLNHGGTFQSHQFNFEKNKLFFPVDYPFTKQGYLENLLNSSVKKEKWTKKPNSKKLQYNKLKIHKHDEFAEFEKNEIGDPFGCDWRYLQLLKISLNKLKEFEATEDSEDHIMRTSSWDPVTQERKIEQLHDVYEFIKGTIQNDEELILLERSNLDSLPISLHLDKSQPPSIPLTIHEPLPVIPISIEMPYRGSPTANARLYSVPPQDLDQWLKTTNSTKITGLKNNDIKPPVPHSSRLVGFVTSGSFNLGKGFGTGVGAIDARYVHENGSKYLIVRNTGEDFGRLCHWTTIEL